MTPRMTANERETAKEEGEEMTTPTTERKMMVEVYLGELREDVRCRRCDNVGGGYCVTSEIVESNGVKLLTWLCPDCVAALASRASAERAALKPHVHIPPAKLKK